MKQKGGCEDAHHVSQCPPLAAPAVWYPAPWMLGLQHAGIQVGRGPPACPGQGQGQLAKIQLPFTRGFCSPVAGSFCWELVAQWKRWQPRQRVAGAGPRLPWQRLPGLCPSWRIPSLCGSHSAAGFLFLSLIFHRFSRSLWAPLYNDAESQKFQLLPESVWDWLYCLVSPNETQPSAVGELLYLFINTNCVFLLAPCRCCRDCWPALVAWCSWQTPLSHKPLPGRCSPPGFCPVVAVGCNFIITDPYAFYKWAQRGLRIFAGQLLTTKAPSFQHRCCQNRRKNREVMPWDDSGEGGLFTSCLCQGFTVKRIHWNRIAILPSLLRCFVVMDFTGKAWSAWRHFCSPGTQGSSELCEVGGTQSCPACAMCPRAGQAGSAVKPFDTFQSPQATGSCRVFLVW